MTDDGTASQPAGVEPVQLSLAALSTVRLDELLQEVLDRVGDIVDSRERLRSLLDAVVGISTDLDLRSTLRPDRRRSVSNWSALGTARSA